MKRTLILVTALSCAATLAGCSGSSDNPTVSGGSSASVTTQGSADAQTATIGTTDNLRFTPTTVNAKVGKVTLTIDNQGNTPHNLHFDDSSLGKTPTIAGKASKPLQVTFSKAGTFTFLCTFHDGMTGKVVVS
jgi:plastocyanin